MVTNYKDSMNLPKTDFPMRANLKDREPAWVQSWERDGLFARILARRDGAPDFILHDGPPYANGHIHMGTAYNKILKDSIVKYKTMRGYRSPYVPGWDCHGQPIEHKVEEELGPEAMAAISRVDLRAKCRDYALGWIDVQRAEFKRLGVLGDWDDPYLTLRHSYEAGNVKVFKKLYLDGSIYRGRKSIHWCMHCHTALAEAEIEYADEPSPSIFVKFDFVEAPEAFKIPCSRHPENGLMPVKLVIWTTTPWTLPANVAVALNPEADYVGVVRDKQVLIMAAERVEAVAAQAGWDFESCERLHYVKDAAGEPLKLKGTAFEGLHYACPIFPDERGVVITEPYVDLSTGTGAVHTAPGHGQEDYLSGQRWHLPTKMPVDDNGVFDAGGGPFKGRGVFEAEPEILSWLREHELLLAAADFTHSYPHCWRCKSPVIFRATEQWFVSMEDTGLRARALEGFDKFRWIPDWSRNRMGAMITERPDWCISRQRSWGVPIPVHHCASCGAVVANEATFDATIALFEAEGADAWFIKDPSEYLPADTVCPDCGGSELTPESDIVDVWWESGVSHTSVLQTRPELSFPAQMYLEGTDQHRGWFQAAYLTSEAAYGRPPFENLLTHGFTVDGEGRKMSKSIGNTISPIEITDKFGADIIRLWVATTDFTQDVGISDEILERTAESYRKIRNTFRFLLSNLSDFEPGMRRATADLAEVDAAECAHAAEVLRAVTAANDDWQFHVAQRQLSDYISELSSTYLDLIKDRLYAEAPDSPARRSAQTVLYELLQMFVRVYAPTLAFTCEEVWSFMPESYRAGADSVHLCDWPELEAPADGALTEAYRVLRRVREQVTKALEEARAAGVAGKSQEAALTLCCDPGTAAVLRARSVEGLQEYFIVATVELCEDAEISGPAATRVEVRRSELEKCPRCWNHRALSGDADFAEVCGRCASVLHEIGFTADAE
ncbi:MAG: isoleucine--tRNA ligase [Actinomycetia bacterium]|nr:isoleucine--tRNA ligase [Actinomycetes bacterium]